MFYYDRELLNLLPAVLRARDFHLYLEGGKRLTDLYLAGGRCILGHKPPRVVGELKNAAERGLFAPFPHPLEKRFINALGSIFPDRAFRLYADSFSLFQALAQAGFDPENDKNISLWRPFLDMDEASVMIPVLPWPLGPEVLVIDKGLDESFPSGELIPPVLLAPAARALYDLVSEMKNRAFPRYIKIEKALANSAWRRAGIYLSVDPNNIERNDYLKLFQDFLEGGFLIPPSPLEPAIFPPSMTPGEESKLADLLG